MGVVTEVERKLARKRCLLEADGMPELRTSTMTHIVWAPPMWVPRAKRVLAGLAERHPSRTIILVPLEGRKSSVEADATVRDFELPGGREVLSEVIELRLRGDAADHPASVVLPLLISDLPAFCRWRGQPDWSSPRSPSSSMSATGSSSTPTSGATCRPATPSWHACSRARPSRTSPGAARCPGAPSSRRDGRGSARSSG